MRRAFAWLLAAVALLALAGCGMSQDVEAAGAPPAEAQGAGESVPAPKSMTEDELRQALQGEWLILGDFIGQRYLTVGNRVMLSGFDYVPLEVDAAAMTARADFGSQKVELTLDDTGERPVVTLALTVDGAEQEPVMLMQPEDHAAWCAENIVEVEITTDNLAEYIGGEIFLSDILNKEGEDIGDDYCCFASPAYDRGLVYVGCSRDFYLSTETDEGLDLDYFEEGQSPYSPFIACVPGAEETGSLVQNWDLTAVDGWGTLYYLPAEKVADVSLVTHEIAGHRDTTRVVTTTDGYKLTDKGNAGRYDNSNMYNYFYDADIQF